MIVVAVVLVVLITSIGVVAALKAHALRMENKIPDSNIDSKVV